MAKKPTKTSGLRVSNIMGILRGNFDFKAPTEEIVNTASYGSEELISTEERSKILSGSLRAVDNISRQPTTAGSLMSMVQSSLSHVGKERLENRQILQLMPEVDKAARLMVASIFSPNDLTRHNIAVKFDCNDISEVNRERLNEIATNFFQKQLNLKTQAPSWVYQFGYETGACVFAIIPLRSFQHIQDQSYLGTESFIENVVDPICCESLFGFGDSKSYLVDSKNDVVGLESFCDEMFLKEAEALEIKPQNISKDEQSSESLRSLISKMIGHEALSLTDNPSILQAREIAKERRTKRTSNLIKTSFKLPMAQTVVSVSAEKQPNGEDGVLGNPIFMRLPPESVTIIHTPGDPNDHQGYLILLDHTGNPINAASMELTASQQKVSHTSSQSNVFSQTYNAYGLTSGFRGMTNEETMGRIYTQIVSEHLKKRLGKAGYDHVEMINLDSTFRCMFGRFLQQKQTRILFLPKDLVSYMTFEKDPNGYGVSRLDRIKFNLGMKMAVQVSRVLAGIKAAMDKRSINVRFNENMMEQPEAVFQNIIREYTAKSTMSFSINPDVIQSQIADKSISIKATDIPGMETFELTNEPDNRTSSVDFDPSILEYLDKQITNGLHVPAATMNSLSEDEYARSVTTTNLFFAMDVAIDQDITIKVISDLLRKYARYSGEFHKEIYDAVPALAPKKNKSGQSSTDETDPNSQEAPINYTLDNLIDSMGISLPQPNVAPSKAQFESLDGMITAITTMINALLPDELAGPDDSLRPVIATLRAKFISNNIKLYLEGSGMANFDIPNSNFSAELGDMITFTDAIRNVGAMFEDKANIANKAKETGDTPQGYA